MNLIVYKVDGQESYILDGRFLGKRNEIVRQVKYNEDWLNWLSRNTEIREVYILEGECINYYRRFHNDLCWAPLVHETPFEEDYEPDEPNEWHEIQRLLIYNQGYLKDYLLESESIILRLNIEDSEIAENYEIMQLAEFLSWLSANEKEIKEVIIFENGEFDIYRFEDGYFHNVPIIEEQEMDRAFEIEKLVKLENENESLRQELELLRSANRELQEKCARGN